MRNSTTTIAPTREQPASNSRPAKPASGAPAASARGIEATRTLERTLAKIPWIELCISQLDIHGNLAMTSSTVFTSNRSQAVRLPKAVAFPAGVHQVDILKIGRSRLIGPATRGTGLGWPVRSSAVPGLSISTPESAVAIRLE